jgi:hypothetical protein
MRISSDRFHAITFLLELRKFATVFQLQKTLHKFVVSQFRHTYYIIQKELKYTHTLLNMSLSPFSCFLLRNRRNN